MSDDIYQFKANKLAGDEQPLEQFRGKVLLIVNTASKCGFTPQYEGLENLYKKYRDKGLEILGFPCNQFGHQEPGSADEITDFCNVNYGVSFPMFEKIDVNGTGAHPLYKFLKKSAPGVLGSEAVKWNFTKFLVDRDGKVVDRFAPKDTPEKIDSEIKQLLA